MQSWARMARPRCPECGHQPLGWTTAAQLFLVIDDLRERKHVADLVQLAGADAEAWRCEQCGNWGIFGPTEVVVPSRAERRRAARRH